MILIEDLQLLLSICYKLYKEYNWLLNAYVSDFYLKNHWNQLPKCWRESLENLKPEILSEIIDVTKPLKIFQVLPLSLISLRQSIKYLSLSRKWDTSSLTKPRLIPLMNQNILTSKHFQNSFWKRVKLKKKHEIQLMAEMCYKLATETQCYYIVDVGSGLGHLSRLLYYKYRLHVCALEAQQYLSTEASKLDSAIGNTMKKYFNVSSNRNLQIKHLNVRVQTNCNGEDILEAVKMAFGADNIQFGIVGLHPCGDLGPTLLRLFNRSLQVKFINIVGCCYMKLSSLGYPLSTYSTVNKYNLEYSSREIACHAIEAYINKLKAGQYNQLKIHAYRAALEKLIVQKSPHLFHSQICSVKCTDSLTFSEYCFKTLSNLDIHFNTSDFEKIETELKDWKNVVVFYSLRLMMAPLVENIITLDRILYALQDGYFCQVNPIFDPELSPRNQVFTAVK